jgi:hypothetical protein
MKLLFWGIHKHPMGYMPTSSEKFVSCLSQKTVYGDIGKAGVFIHTAASRMFYAFSLLHLGFERLPAFSGVVVLQIGH